MADGSSAALSLGNDVGFSVQEVIDTVRGVTEREIKVTDVVHWERDLPRLVADATLERVLGW